MEFAILLQLCSQNTSLKLITDWEGRTNVRNLQKCFYAITEYILLAMVTDENVLLESLE